jgi:hypothetical protein
MALNKKIEEEYRLEEKGKNALHIRKYVGYQLQSDNQESTENESVDKGVGVDGEDLTDKL